MTSQHQYLAELVDEFYQLGIREVVFSPGSRSTALALLFEHYGKFKTFVNLDERSAGFFGLGISKGQQRPVVLVCTSGSAGAHYFPAVVEAAASRVPLIILTADRPAQLQFVGAPQTMDQTRLFGHFVKHFEELTAGGAARKVAQKAMLMASDQPAGPMQINIPLDEPLLPDLSSVRFGTGRGDFAVQLGKPVVNGLNLKSKKVLILAGPDYSSDYQKALIQLAERLKAPILADPLSNLRAFDSSLVLDAYDAFLAKAELTAQTILLFGQIPVSKRLQAFLSRQQEAEFIQIDPAANYRNPLLTTTQLVKSDPRALIESLQFVNSDRTYLERWQFYQKAMRAQLDQVNNEKAPFEGRYVRLLQKLLPENAQLLVANSMPIRDVDYFWKAGVSQAKLYGNRGVNGIDGTESTALGLSTNGKPTVLLTGDLSMLHDLNGLIVGKTEELSLTIVLFNNDGGGIFEYLPQKGQPGFERLFSTPHDLDFGGLAQLLGLDYHLIKDYSDFAEYFTTASGIHLLEIRTDRARSTELHRRYTDVPVDLLTRL